MLGLCKNQNMRYERNTLFQCEIAVFYLYMSLSHIDVAGKVRLTADENNWYETSLTSFQI